TMNRRRAVLCVIASLASGCGSVLRTEALDPSSHEVHEGVPYSLPMTVFEVDLEVREAAEGSGSSGGKPAPPPPKVGLGDRSKTAERERGDAESEGNRAGRTEGQPPGNEPPSTPSVEPKKPLEVVLSLTPVRVPDPGHTYLLKHTPNLFFSDDVTVRWNG